MHGENMKLEVQNFRGVLPSIVCTWYSTDTS